MADYPSCLLEGLREYQKRRRQFALDLSNLRLSLRARVVLHRRMKRETRIAFFGKLLTFVVVMEA